MIIRSRYLSFSPFDQPNIDRVWPLITNTEAIAIDQQWSGDPGSLLKSSENHSAPFYPFQPNINGTAPVGSKKGSFFTWQVWSKALPEGKVAVLLLNTGVDVAAVNVTWQELKAKYPSSLSCCEKTEAHHTPPITGSASYVQFSSCRTDMVCFGFACALQMETNARARSAMKVTPQEAEGAT